MHLRKMPRRLGGDLFDLLPEEALDVSARRILVGGRSELVWVETPIWNELELIAHRKRMSVEDLCTEIADESSYGVPLASGIRLYVLEYYRSAAMPAEKPRLLS
ncbi:ribbon-helix-helix domain-containing protein [Azospirillum sp. SYSU D00513]|uniref:ribbon-helix-helix domain-containing protein n=1 Tax=Azospirillum sp. SYSU D00513 TaxID=2812561 RepID=UPI001A95B042|nr:ribbon-helix-helix domain-containing protein [Azospirillum sp. SYSU D00513]